MSEAVGQNWKWREVSVPEAPLRIVKRETIDRVVAALGVPAYLTAPPPSYGNVLMVGQENYAVMGIALRGLAEGWDRRRIKREARKGTRSKYRKRQAD